MERRGFKTARPVARIREGRNDWFRIENKTDAVAKVYIYDEIGYLGVTAQDFVTELNQVKASQINLHLNTPGGDVFDGLAIYNSLRNHSAKVTTIIDGIAASAGSFIAQAGERVIMRPQSQMMIHDAHGLVIGNGKDMAEMAALLDKQSDNIAAIYAERTGKPAAFWRDAMSKETWYSDQEAVAAGLAHEVSRGSGDEPAPAKNTFDLSIFAYGSRDEAPAPVLEPDPVSFDWDSIANALKGAFA